MKTNDDGDCPICGCSMEWESCHACFGDGGFHDCGEDTCVCADPEEITEVCGECKGDGGYLVCINAENHAKILAKRKPVQP